MKKVFQHYFFRFSALTFGSVLLFFSMAFADLSAKHEEVSSLSSYTEFKDLAFALKEKMVSGSESYEDLLLLNALRQAISDSDIAPDARASLLNNIAGIKQLCPEAFLSRSKRNLRTARETDTISPELVSLEISPSVIDLSEGPKDIVFTASTTDSGGSGVDSVVIYVSPDMPDGYSFVGIWDNWDDTGWTDGEHSRTYTFPQYTAPGVYTIQKVEVEDKAGNETVYSASDLADMGAPTQFTVEGSAADTTSPELTKLSISPSAADVSGGEAELTFTASATDTGSGVESVVIYVSPDMPDGYSFVGIWDNWDDTGWTDGEHSRTYTLPQYTAPGVYTIQKVEVEDKAGNEKIYSASDLSSMGASTQFTVEGGAADTNAPELTSLDISPSVADISGGQADITLTASATDTGAGVDSVVIYVSPDMPDGYSFVGIWDDWDDTGWTDGEHSRIYTFPQYTTPGVYTIQKVEVEDKAGNEKVYSGNDLANMGASTQFEITDTPQNPVLSVTPPLREVSKTGESVTFEVKNMGGGTMNWTASADDSHFFISLANDSGVNDGTITVSCENMDEDVSATITVSAPGAESSPQTVEVRNYGGEIPAYTISGHVSGHAIGSGNISSGIGGVTLSFSNGGGSTMTDTSGFYSNSVEYGWSGTVTPGKDGYKFSPAFLSYSNVASDSADQNYSADLISYTISGTITDSGGNPVSGAIVSFSNNTGTGTTDNSGFYSKTVAKGWSGTVTPLKDGYALNPENRSYDNVGSDQAGQNYTASATSVPDIEATPKVITFTKSGGKRDRQNTSDETNNSVGKRSSYSRNFRHPLGEIIPEDVETYWQEHTPSRKYRSLRDLPPSKDWSVYDSPVKDQGRCGSCWAFATAALVENLAKQANYSLDISEQELVSCSKEKGCGGGWRGDALYYIQQNGAIPESCYPYKEWDINCDSKCREPEYTVKISKCDKNAKWGWEFSTDDLKGALQDGPLTVGMKVYEDFMSYKDGIYHHEWGGNLGGHAVLLVGYDDAQQYFKAKNSWGESWGEGGYFRIAYDTVDDVKFGKHAAGGSGFYMDEIKTVSEDITIVNSGTGELVISSIFSDRDWLDISKQSIPNISPGGQETITVSVKDWNAIGQDESAKLTISSNDPDEPSLIVEIVMVIPEMLSMPEIFVPIPVELQDVVSDRGDTIEISVLNAGDGTLNWTATTDASWITIISGSGAEDGKIEFTCKANSNSAERTGTITISASGALNNPQTVEVRQAAATIIEREPYGDINDDGFINLGDVILALQVLSGTEAAGEKVRFDFIGSDADINKDGKVGTEEAIYVLQYVLYEAISK